MIELSETGQFDDEFSNQIYYIYFFFPDMMIPSYLDWNHFIESSFVTL